MARDLDDAIAEEEEYESEDAEQVEEQEFKDEYEDTGGESTAPSVNLPGAKTPLRAVFEKPKPKKKTTAKAKPTKKSRPAAGRGKPKAKKKK